MLCRVAAVKSLPVHNHGAGFILFPLGSLSHPGYFENQIPLKPVYRFILHPGQLAPPGVKLPLGSLPPGGEDTPGYLAPTLGSLPPGVKLPLGSLSPGGEAASGQLPPGGEDTLASFVAKVQTSKATIFWPSISSYQEKDAYAHICKDQFSRVSTIRIFILKK